MALASFSGKIWGPKSGDSRNPHFCLTLLCSKDNGTGLSTEALLGLDL